MNKELLLHVEHLKKDFDTTSVLKDISLDVYKGDIVSIIGPSGSGKSTFLRCLNLLEIPSGGNIYFQGIGVNKEARDQQIKELKELIKTSKNVEDVKKAKQKLKEIKTRNINQIRRDMIMVFQSFNLFNNMNVLQNVVFAQRKILKRSKKEAEEIAMKYQIPVDVLRYYLYETVRYVLNYITEIEFQEQMRQNGNMSEVILEKKLTRN